MTDWIAVLRAVAEKAGRLALDNAKSGIGHVAFVMDCVSRAAADELERQRDAAQGAMRESASDIGSAASPETPWPPASSDACDFRPDSTAACSRGTQGCWKWHELDTLRAQLAEREAELAAIKSSERERLIRDACGAWDGGSTIADQMNRLSAHERARRAKEKP